MNRFLVIENVGIDTAFIDDATKGFIFFENGIKVAFGLAFGAMRFKLRSGMRVDTLGGFAIGTECAILFFVREKNITGVDEK